MVRRLTFTGLSGREMPLLPAGLSFAGGIALSARTNCEPALWLGLALVMVALFPLLERWAGRRLATLGLVAGFVATGGGLHSMMEITRGRDSPAILFDCGALRIEEPVELYAQLVADPELAPDRIYLYLELERVRSLQRSYQARGGVRIIVPFSDDRSRLEYDALGIRYGARLRMIAQLRVRREYGNPGAPPFDEILESQGLVATGWVRSPLLIEKLDPGRPGRLAARLFSLRSDAIRLFLRHLPPPTAGLLIASLFGNRYFLTRDTAEPFRIGGTFHLLVISGLHMAMIATVVFWLLRRMTGYRFVQYGGCLLVVWSYGVMVGAQPAVMRAVVMLTLVLIGQYLFRQLSGGNSLAGAGIVLLAWQPGDLFNPGFQVSYLTVGVIVFLTGPVLERVREIGRWRPTTRTPWPPRVSTGVAWIAEVLYWDDWRDRREMGGQKVRFRLFKAHPARWISRWRLQPLLRWVVATVVTTTGVQLALLPLMISGFHRFSLLSPLINVVEAVLVTALMGLGVIFLLFHLLLAEWACEAVPIIDRLGHLTVDLGARAANWPGGGWRVPDFGPSAVILYSVYGGGLLLLTVMINRWNPLARGDGPGDQARRRLRRCCALLAGGLVIAIAALLVTHPHRHIFDRGRLSLTFLDVGQGDAIVVSFPQGRLMMVDSGGDAVFHRQSDNDDADGGHPFIEDRLGIAEAAVLPYLWSRGIDRLDWIVASHGDNDHIGGFTDLVRNLRTGEALQARGEDGRFRAEMRAAGVPIRELSAGECWDIDGVKVEVLAGSGRGNNGSLVIRLRFGQRSFMLTGDIEKEAERELVGRGGSLQTDVLKVAHHGSATSSTAEFLDRTQAAIAVISAGRNNSFGHPSPQVVERLRSRGMKVYETSRVGAITISTDGTDLRTEHQALTAPPTEPD